MDLILEALDLYFFTPYVYPESWPEDNWLRQFFSLLIVVNVGGVIMYFAFASFSFFFVYESRAHETSTHSGKSDP